MNFYRLSSWAVGGRKYPWACGFGPLAEMPFLDGLPALRERCEKYWEVNPSPPGMVIDPGGKSWSDFIGNGSGGPCSFFVSERVVRDLAEEKIEILRATEMPIARIDAKTLQKIAPPKYFVIEAIPGISFTSESVSVEEQLAALKRNPLRRISPVRWKCQLAGWSGNDLCSPALSKVHTTLICTERIKRLGERKGWTNVQFDSVKLV